MPLEPEWEGLKNEAGKALDKLILLWETQAARVEKYQAAHPLEEAFIQPVLETLGWKLNYQPRPNGWKPDYALFLSDSALD
ncbi:MAG: hypothetical protein ACREDR_10915, partial [Blastocatellia bacterium]